ncbi:MAG: ATP-dependent protease ATPase subunit HslU [Clostridiales bacterium]|nr:ATP-dependent protease ATPase subunit HslU [Clostridiales bacterium]
MLTPRQIVDALDAYIIGQTDAKRAVAVALRNRYRRSRLTPELRDEITPKNILMMGPTGVGKTEIARRLAKLVDAPFVKVEATKFTEVGYVGRDVESMVRDLVEESIRLIKNRKMKEIQLIAAAAAEQRLADLLMPQKRRKAEKQPNPLQLLLGGAQGAAPEQETPLSQEEMEKADEKRRAILEKLRRGELENETVEVEIQEREPNAMFAIGVDVNLQDMMGELLPKKRKRRKMSVASARRILVQQESERRVNMDEVYQEAVESAEQHGIVFIDEIDKICGSTTRHGPDVSREGVQRDILPIVEGSTVQTKYGPVKTDFMLFIAAGAFHISKVTDLIPELQGRFPIRVKLDALSETDFYQILTQPQNAVTKQYTALLGADNVQLSFTDAALRKVASVSHAMNEGSENIGARRLHTVMEELLSDISFHAGGDHPQIELAIDEHYVEEHLAREISENSIHKYIL